MIGQLSDGTLMFYPRRSQKPYDDIIAHWRLTMTIMPFGWTDAQFGEILEHLQEQASASVSPNGAYITSSLDVLYRLAVKGLSAEDLVELSKNMGAAWLALEVL